PPSDGHRAPEGALLPATPQDRIARAEPALGVVDFKRLLKARHRSSSSGAPGLRPLAERGSAGGVAFEDVVGEEGGIAVGGGALATATGKVELDQGIGRDPLLGLGIGRPDSVDQDFARGPGLTAAKAGGGVHGAVAEDRADEGFARPHAKRDALAEP